MRGQQDRLLAALELLDDVVDFAAHLRIEAGGRLVEKYDLRIVHQRHGQRQALLLAAGEMAVERVALFFELESAQQVVRVRALAIELREKLEGFVHAELVRQGSGLQYGADLLLEVIAACLRIEAADAHLAAIRRAQAFQDFHGGRFSRAVRAEQAENFAFLDREADAAHRLHGAVALVEILDLYDWLAHGMNPFVSGSTIL